MGKAARSTRGPGFLALVLVLVIMTGHPARTRGQVPVQNSAQSVLAPTATIYSSETEVCQGGSVTAYIYLSGDGPWSVEVSDKDSVYLSLSVLSSRHELDRGRDHGLAQRHQLAASHPAEPPGGQYIPDHPGGGPVRGDRYLIRPGGPECEPHHTGDHPSGTKGIPCQ